MPFLELLERQTARQALQTLERTVLVCNHSGYRGEGLTHVIYENRNMYESFTKYRDIAEEYPWFIGVIEENDLFFENFLTALRPTFPTAGSPDGWHTLADCRPKQWLGHDYSKSLRKFDVFNSECKLECFERVLRVCDPTDEPGLLYQQNLNRKALTRFLELPVLLEKIPWVQSWIHVKELFFEDLRRALRLSAEQSEPWRGDSLNIVLLSFNSGEIA